jgi:virulence factor Mce-like protein
VSNFRLQLRRYAVQGAAVLVLIAVGIAVGAVIVAHQRFNWPWEDFYVVSARFRTAQAVMPGQGQQVTISGVAVGDVKSVELENEVAVVTVQIEPRYAPIYRDARMTMRPRTAAQDMTIALDPGTPSAGALGENAVLPTTHTTPNVNTDEVFASLDADTRTYLKMLVSGLGEGLQGRRRQLHHLLAMSKPTATQSRRLSAALASRRREIASLVHNVNLVSRAAASRQREIGQVIDSSNATLGALARQDAPLRSSLRQLPGTLAAAEAALPHIGTLFGELRPAAAALRPAVRELPQALHDARPLLEKGTPIIRAELRPLVQAALPVIGDLRPGARDLRVAVPQTLPTLDRTNRLVNELVYDPPGAERGYLYFLPWFAHNLNSVTSVEDAHGAFARGMLIGSCSDVSALQQTLGSISGIHLNLPDVSSLPVCAGGGGP